jgi:hypothetical protein
MKVNSWPHLPPKVLPGVGPFNPQGKQDFEYGSNEIVITPPIRFRTQHFAEVAVDLRSELWGRYPKDQSTCNLIWQHSWPTHYGISAALGTAARPSLLTINLPTEWAALQAYFRARGYEARYSRAGRYGSALLDLIGGLKAASAFASLPAYRLLDGLALKSSLKVAERLRTRLPNITLDTEELAKLLSDVEVVPELKRVPKSLSQLKAAFPASKPSILNLLDDLSALQVVKRGIHIPCPHCDTPTWHALQNLDEWLTCPGCSEDFRLPIQYPNKSGREIEWEYTLNSLVNRVMDQDVLPHILALHFLTKDADTQAAHTGIELFPADSKDAAVEFDFVFVSESVIRGGECKTGSEIGDKDIATAELAQKLGFGEFTFCTTSCFSPESAERISSLAARLAGRAPNMSIKTLGGNDIFGTESGKSEARVDL